MKLSVMMITYNHEKFIAQALDSVLMQNVNFDYEIVVGEDCSTDNTRGIVCEYQRRYPDKIRLLIHETNLGMIRNIIHTYKECTGDYIAYLEGDDYWTSSFKLQKQVDFLENHADCSSCFHNVDVVYENEAEKNHFFHHERLQKIFTLREVVSHHFIPTLSTMFRNRLFPEFPSWFLKMPMGDWPLHVLNAQHGDVGYIDEVLGAYRVHDGGVWSSRKRVDILRSTIHAAHVLNKYLEYKFNTELKHNIVKWHCEIAKILIDENNINVAILHICKSTFILPHKTDFSRRNLIKSIIRKSFSGPYKFFKKMKTNAN